MNKTCEPLLIGIEQEPKEGESISFKYVYSCDECKETDCKYKK